MDTSQHVVESLSFFLEDSEVYLNQEAHGVRFNRTSSLSSESIILNTNKATNRKTKKVATRYH